MVTERTREAEGAEYQKQTQKQNNSEKEERMQNPDCYIICRLRILLLLFPPTISFPVLYFLLLLLTDLSPHFSYSHSVSQRRLTFSPSVV